jgi:tetratricopeptide (TPR) repeat protein
VWCKKLDRDTYTDKRVIRLSGQVVPVKLDAQDEGEEIAKKYGVRNFPTILFINGDGQVEGQISGYMPPEGFIPELTKYVEAHRDLPKLEARIKSNPRDTEVAAKLASIYAGRKEIERAEAMLKVAERDRRSPLLAKAYYAVGDHYQLSGEYDTAVPFFEKAIKVGQTPYDVAYGRISIAACRLSQDRLKEAIPVLEALVEMPNAPAEFKEQGRQLLKIARKKK